MKHAFKIALMRSSVAFILKAYLNKRSNSLGSCNNILPSFEYQEYDQDDEKKNAEANHEDDSDGQLALNPQFCSKC